MDWFVLFFALFWCAAALMYARFAALQQQTLRTFPGPWFEKAGGRLAATLLAVGAGLQAVMVLFVRPRTMWSSIGVFAAAFLVATVIAYAMRARERQP